MKRLILLFACLALVGCSVSFPNTQSTPTYSDLVVSMERGPCFGTCAVYKLIIHADGAVEYEGEGFVKIKGKRNTKINLNQIQELVGAIESTKFFLLEDQYAASATDLPSVTLTVTLNGRKKSIWHYGMLDCSGNLDVAPKQLCELENKIDEIVNSSQWVK